MQQVGPERDIWTKASRSPAPRPVLNLSAASGTLVAFPSWSAGRAIRTAGFVLVAMMVAVVALGARSLGPASQLTGNLERWMQLAGLGIDQVALTGHRFTIDTDIFDAIGLKRQRTMLSFDSAAAQSRIEELPWIERASIERVFPDRLEVRVTERIPAAIWLVGEQSLLIDATGRTLGPAQKDAISSLLRVRGAGAAGAVTELFALLKPYAELQQRISVAERIGGRRWCLRLAGDAAIQLPSADAAAALSRAVRFLSNGFPHAEIDLRVAGRTIIRDHRGAQAQLAGTGRSASGRP